MKITTRMAYIFMDESGDLGFDFSKKKTSKFFIISFLFIDDETQKKQIEKIVKTVFAGFTKKEVKFHHGALHAYKETLKTRTYVPRTFIKSAGFRNVHLP